MIQRFAIVCALALLIVAPTGCHRAPADESAALYSRVTSVNKLVLARMAVTKMASVDDIALGEAVGLKQTAAAIVDAMKVGKRRAAYSYDTWLRAYIPLDRLAPGDVVVDEASRTIRLRLPDVRVEFEGRDIPVREEHYRVSGLRSHINASERARLKESMNTALKEEVRRDPAFADALTSRARAKAVAYFQNLLAREGFTVLVEFV